MLRPPIEPMRAAAVTELPSPRMCRGGCGYEPKFDGWRCLAFVRHGGAFLQSRHGRDLTPYFPDIAAQLAAALPAETVVDGELIVWDSGTARTSFAGLQARVVAGRRLPAVAAAQPASLVVFDVLEHAGTVLLDRPLHARRAVLETALTGGPTSLPVCPLTRDVTQAQQWFDDLAVTGVEGLVIKDLAAAYRPGRPGWWKLKRRTTTEAIIGGVLGDLSDPQALLLGRRHPGRRLRYVGRTTALTAAQRAELRPMLIPAGIRHPWPSPMPAAWSGQFDQRDPIDYVQVRPLLVAEIVVDEAYERGRWRHPVRHVRIRPDLAVTDVPPPMT